MSTGSATSVMMLPTRERPWQRRTGGSRRRAAGCPGWAQPAGSWTCTSLPSGSVTLRYWRFLALSGHRRRPARGRPGREPAIFLRLATSGIPVKPIPSICRYLLGRTQYHWRATSNDRANVCSKEFINKTTTPKHYCTGEDPDKATKSWTPIFAGMTIEISR
jgi:hypothetical protein